MTTDKLYCTYCKDYKHKRCYKTHLDSKKHKKNVEEHEKFEVVEIPKYFFNG